MDTSHVDGNAKRTAEEELWTARAKGGYLWTGRTPGTLPAGRRQDDAALRWEVRSTARLGVHIARKQGAHNAAIAMVVYARKRGR